MNMSELLKHQIQNHDSLSSLISSGTTTSYVNKSRNERLLRIEIPFKCFHDMSVNIDFESNSLIVDAKLMENSSYHMEKKLPDNLDREKMEHYYEKEKLIIDIPVKTFGSIPSLIMKHTDFYNDYKNCCDRLMQKHLIQKGNYVISEHLGDGFRLEKMQLKIKSSVLILTAIKEKEEFGIKECVNLKREFKLPEGQYDIDNISAKYFKNNTLKITVPVKEKIVKRIL